MATAAFPGHYRAQQGPPMPQPQTSAPVVSADNVSLYILLVI